MAIATKNGVAITKGGSVSTNCKCCTRSPLCSSLEDPPGAITVSLESENYRVAVQWGTGITITTAFFGEYTNGDFVLTPRTANGLLAWWSDPISTPFYTNVSFEPRIGFFPRGYLIEPLSVMLVVPYMLFTEREDSLTTGKSLDFFLEKHSTWTRSGAPDVIRGFSTAVSGDCGGGTPRMQFYNGQPQLSGFISGPINEFPPSDAQKARIAWGVNARSVSASEPPFIAREPWIATRPQIFTTTFLQTAVGLVLNTGLLGSGLSFSEGDPNLWLTGIEENPLP